MSGSILHLHVNRGMDSRGTDAIDLTSLNWHKMLLFLKKTIKSFCSYSLTQQEWSLCNVNCGSAPS